MSSNKPSSSTALAPVARDEQANFMPVLTIEDAIRRRNLMVDYTRQLMQEGRDFGKIPGTDKPTLLKPGAEKLCTIFGLSVEDPEMIEKVEDWTGKDHGEPFFYYLVQQRLTRNGVTIASQVGSCSSWESKYRYRWVSEHDLPEGVDRSKLKRKGGRISEFDFSVEKAETGGKYGKPADYWQAFKDAIEAGTAKRIQKQTKAGKTFDAWEIDASMYRLPNPDIADVVNTVLKMACKRALIAAVLVATNASEFFSQDLEDMEIIDVEFTEAKPREQHAQPAKPANGTPKPAPAKSAHSLPANGSELQKRLTDYDAKLATQKVCAPGALLKRIMESGAKAGYEGSLETWSGPAIQFAVEQTKVFEAECRRQPAQAD